METQKLKNFLSDTITINCAKDEYEEMVQGKDELGNDVLDFENKTFVVVEKIETFTDCFGSIFEEAGWDVICKEVI